MYFFRQKQWSGKAIQAPWNPKIPSGAPDAKPVATGFRVSLLGFGLSSVPSFLPMRPFLPVESLFHAIMYWNYIIYYFVFTSMALKRVP